MVRTAQATVEQATKAQLEALGPVLASSGLATAAVVLARKIDLGGKSAKISPAQLAGAVRELRFTLTALAALTAKPDAPPAEERDPVDELQAQRAARRGVAG